MSSFLHQGSRLDDQRCAPPPPPVRGPTVPDEDFFSLIMRSQAKRMDEQRVTLPSAANSTARPSSSSNWTQHFRDIQVFYLKYHEGVDSVVIDQWDGHSEGSPVSLYICPCGRNKALSALYVVYRMEKISNFKLSSHNLHNTHKLSVVSGTKVLFF